MRSITIFKYCEKIGDEWNKIEQIVAVTGEFEIE